MAATLLRDAADVGRSVAAEIPRVALASLAGIGALTALSAWIGVPDDEAFGFARALGVLCELGSVLGVAAYLLGSLWCARPTAGQLNLNAAVLSAALAVMAINIISFVLVPIPASGRAFYALVTAIAGAVFFHRRFNHHVIRTANQMYREDRGSRVSP